MAFGFSNRFLLDGGLSIKEIAARLGFHSPAHFSVEFKKRVGQSPAVYRMSLQ
jgi:AraC-like DNA-binding protein